MKKMFNSLRIIGIALLLGGCNLTETNSNSVDLHLITDYQTQKYGFIDSKGNIVIEPIYKQASVFSEGLAAIQQINSSGEAVYGYINAKGEIIIQPQYKTVSDFKDGVAWVKKDPNLRNQGMFINKKGEIIYEVPFYIKNSPIFFEFNDGLMPVNINNKWGYIDRTGEIVIALKYDFAIDFSEGLALVRTEDSLYGYINLTGEFVIEPKYQEASINFTDGHVLVKENDSDNFKLIDRNNKLISTIYYSGCQGMMNYSEGLLDFKIKLKRFGKTKCGFIDVKNNIVIEPIYDDVMSFNEGLATVKLNGKWGVIDKSGKFIVQPVHDFIYPFENGLAKITQNPSKLIAYVDREGNYVWQINQNKQVDEN